MIYIFVILCILTGVLIVINIDSPKSFLAKWFVLPVVVIPIGFLARTVYEAGASWSTLTLTIIGFAVLGGVMYYVGMFLIFLFLHWFFRG